MIKLKNIVTEALIDPGEEHECFRNAWRWALKHDDGKTFVVHGKVTNVEGKRFNHAWVEVGNEVVDPTSGVRMDAAKWYKLLNAQSDAKYTPLEAGRNMIKMGHLGPW